MKLAARYSSPSRRTVLLGAAGLLASSVTPASAAPSARHAALTGWLSARSSAAHLGAALETAGLSSLTPDEILAQIAADLRGIGISDGESDPEIMRSAIDTLIRRDFTAGELVILDGWVLSRSEARLYALVWSEELDQP